MLAVAMATTTSLCSSLSTFGRFHRCPTYSSSAAPSKVRARIPKSARGSCPTLTDPLTMAALVCSGLALNLAPIASASELLPVQLPSSFPSEPANALSLPTWTVHVSSVVEWMIAMALVWQYGETSGMESWKGLSWGMVPLLGGALCACTWHFFYNAESLEVLVALQAALTVLGNATMCFAAFRIYKSREQQSPKI